MAASWVPENHLLHQSWHPDNPELRITPLRKSWSWILTAWSWVSDNRQDCFCINRDILTVLSWEFTWFREFWSLILLAGYTLKAFCFKYWHQKRLNLHQLNNHQTDQIIVIILIFHYWQFSAHQIIIVSWLRFKSGEAGGADSPTFN